MAELTGHIPLEGAVDAATVAVGIIVTLGKAAWRTRAGMTPTFSVITTDFLNATVITPFMLMIGAVFSTGILQYLRTASPVSTAIAGAIGLLFVLSELKK